MSDISLDSESNRDQSVFLSDHSVNRSTPAAQSTDKVTAHISPWAFSSPVGTLTNSPQIGTNESLIDFWPPAHLVSGSVTTSEPLAYGKSYTSSRHETTSLSDQKESLSDITSPSAVTTETVLASPTIFPTPPTLTGLDCPSSTSNAPYLESENVESLFLTSPLPIQSNPINLNVSSHVLPPNSSAVLQAALPLFRSVITPPSAQALSPNPLASTLARDTLLTYAHRMFISPFQPALGLAAPPVVCEPSSQLHPYNTQIIPLLRNLKTLHPKHIPILLLLGCVYHAVGDYAESLQQNEEILAIDENFVEAMSNAGTTLKAMGRINDALKWWWKAISIKPVYWDAIYNLMGILISSDSSESEKESMARHLKALELCDFLRSRLVDRNGLLLADVPMNELHHVQNILYVGATIRGTISGSSSENDLVDLMLGIEILLCLDPREKTLRFTFKDFVLAGSIAALILTSALPPTMLSLISNWQSSNQYSVSYSGADLLEFVRDRSYDVLDLLLLDFDGVFPTIFLSPRQAGQLTSLVLSTSQGDFPASVQRTSQGSSSRTLLNNAGAEVGKISSSILLSIAKTLQENRITWLPGFDGRVRSSPSFVLILYYFAFCLHPSPPICNNLGILLSTSPWTAPIGPTGQPYVHQLAKEYYEEGLRLLTVEKLPQWKKSHPHLLTNYGSLLKEMGNIDSAIEIYTEAIKLNPNFDIALANLANAMKDSGRLSESIIYYRRAVEVNEGLPEALCGMVHAVWSICDWRGLGNIGSSMSIDYEGNAHPILLDEAHANGWMPKLIEVTRKQISAAYSLNQGIVQATGTVEEWLGWIEASCDMTLSADQRTHWTHIIHRYYSDTNHEKEMINEGGFIIRIVEWLTKVLQWRWYNEVYGNEIQYPPGVRPLYKSISNEHGVKYRRPRVPPTMTDLPMCSVLPFHTFIYPLNARELRLVARRNAFRTSLSTLTQPWLPEHVYPPPPPPHPRINVGYVSSDFNDHPTSHLLQSVFGLHDRKRFCVYAYATTVSDRSQYRAKIEIESEYFRDVSNWSTQQVVEQIIQDEIHILVNLNGYTKGARNDIFAARPSPVQISFLGFAGTLAAGWCDYMICDVVSCPPGTRLCEICECKNKQDVEFTNSSEIDFNIGPDPESTDGWKYAEKLIYMPHSYLVTDHKQLYGSGVGEVDNNVIQQAWERTELRRRRLREALFPDLLEDTIIFANFNQMYKIDPSIFATWLRVLKRVPNSILWLLRFPSAAEEHLLRTAEQWEGAEIKSRIRFTEVASKTEHIERVCVADIFLDTVECNAHTVAADVLWSGVPIITWPKYDFKMCSRVGASIAHATGYGRQMVVDSLATYEDRAIELALSVTPIQKRNSGDGLGELASLRRNLFMSRGSMPLFDTQRWTRNLEKAYDEAWRRWVQGGTFLHFNVGNTDHQYERCNGFIWIRDEET